MLSRRILAISPDKAVAKQLAIALKAAGGSVETMQSLDPLGRGELQVVTGGFMPNRVAERIARSQWRSRSGATPAKPRAPSKIEAPSQAPGPRALIMTASPVCHLPSNQVIGGRAFAGA
jgi:hypothetical protein